MLGMLNQDALAMFYRVLDLFVDPFYQHHGLNTVMLEAVLSGVPIAVTSLASASTTVPCEDYGITFGLGMVDELVTAVETMISNRTRLAAIRKNIYSKACNKPVSGQG